MASDQPVVDVPRLIALHAADYGGKDTAGRMIEELSKAPPTWVPFTSRAFAAKVKESIAASFGIPDDEDPIVWCDLLKQDHVTVEVRGGAEPIIHETSGRQFIRDFATAGHRELFDPDFWVNVLLPMETGPGELYSWHANFDHAAMCVITDLRFNTEADRVRALGGEVWALIGRGEPFDEHHLSNGDFKWRDADHVLDNSGDFDHLRDQIKALL